MKILAIAAHPDDIEIFMYGLISIYKDRGDQVFTIIVTDGSKGGSEETELLIKTRKSEAINSLKTFSKPIFLNIPDGELGDDPIHKKIIRKNIFKVLPDLIITHSKNDYHSDHRTLSLLIKGTVSHYIPILYCDTLMGLNFQPNFYVDITNYYQVKKDAILKHKSQNPERFVDLFELMNSYRAAQCNAPKGSYAEAYSFSLSFPFSDIRSLLPASPKIRNFYENRKDSFL